PEGVGGLRVAAIAVDDHGVLAFDALGAHEFGEPGAVDVVAGHRIVEVTAPVDLGGAGHMPDVIEQDVFVRFDDLEPGSADVCRQPWRGYESLWVCVGTEGGSGVRGDGHVRDPSHEVGGGRAVSESHSAWYV